MVPTLALLSLSPLLQDRPQDPSQAKPDTPAAAVPAVQAPTAPAASLPADLQALAQRVEAAHRPDGPVPPITAFAASIELRVLDKTREQRGQVDLDVQFLEWTAPGSKKVRPLIRYEIRDAAAPVVRGRDRFGPWQLTQNEPRDLTGADAAEDLAQFEQHTNLARQMLRFLSPGTVLRELQRPGPVTDQVLTMQRGLVVPCRTVSGRVESFPLLRHEPGDTAVEIRLWIDAATGRLVTVDAAPVRGDVVDRARGERVLLLDFVPRDGVLVPEHVKHLFFDGEGKLTPWSEVHVAKLVLRPRLDEASFARKK